MMHKTDEELKNAVLAELRWENRVKETEVGVTVDKGVVTLTGAVNSYGKKLAAQEAAHRVTGVLDVANDIKVKPIGISERDDSDIAKAVRHALEWDVWVHDQNIHSSVSDGWVTLDGQVETLAEKNDAERAVNKLVGVRGVTNYLVVTPKATSADVKDLIQGALERRADHEANRIEVTVRDGVVTLKGKVRNYGEKRAILGAISHSPGVKSVKDHLMISPFA
ncbi:MAG: BON domain-containing protein [Acidobacteria bacterium]|nr:BON domain-containing protein [Acidobacteriota bacterium]